MQVARLLEPREHRSLGAKLRQIVRALELEHALGKDEILALYLTLAPYGGNLEGIRAAALAYFGKEPRKLSLAEAALLVALPQSPELRRPDRFPDAARAARDRVLDRVAAAGVVPGDEIARAQIATDAASSASNCPCWRRTLPTRLCRWNPIDACIGSPSTCSLQKNLQDLARERAQALGPDISVAILAVDNASGEVRGRVASADYFDARRAGQVDMTQALRSPGSTLKPFIYGLAFEDGLIHPETLIDDKPTRYGSYTPENFDLTFQGTVTVRRALQLSLNVPAIAVLGKVGVNRLSARLAQTGAALVLPKGEAPGLAMGLGGVGVRLSDLVMLYAGLARLGAAVPLTERQGRRRAKSPPDCLIRLPPGMSATFSSARRRRTNAPHGRVAFKTGTSYGYRDAWAIGFDGRMTIGVWVGRPDGAPVPGLVGRASAAPILFDAFARSGLCARSITACTQRARSSPPATSFRRRCSALASAAQARRSSRRASCFRRTARAWRLPAGGRLDPVALKIAGGRAPLTVMVNGVPLAAQSGRGTLFFQPDGPGFVRLTVMDARGAADSVTVRLQ